MATTGTYTDPVREKSNRMLSFTVSALGTDYNILLFAYASKALLVCIACILSVAKGHSENLYWFQRFVDIAELHFSEGITELTQFSPDEYIGNTDSNIRPKAIVVINTPPSPVE
jgi:hypothetical protein